MTEYETAALASATLSTISLVYTEEYGGYIGPKHHLDILEQMSVLATEMMKAVSPR